jgi:hypothetical protein
MCIIHTVGDWNWNQSAMPLFSDDSDNVFSSIETGKVK